MATEDNVPVPSAEEVAGVGAGGGGEEQGRERENRPHEVIKVKVTGYQLSAKDFSYQLEIEVGAEKKALTRHYNDLLWLHRVLSKNLEPGGYIVPPMPAPPPRLPDATVMKLGDHSRSLFGDQTEIPRLAMEGFMQVLASHPYFSENHIVYSFLTREQLSDHDQQSASSLWSQFSKVISDYQISSVVEPDEHFTRCLKSVEKHVTALLACSQDFARMCHSWQNFACSLMAVTEEMRLLGNNEESRNEQCARYCFKFAEGLEEDKEYSHAASLDSMTTIGFTFDLYHKYYEQVKEMLFRRLAKVQLLTTASQQLEKARPDKRPIAEKAKEDAQKTLDRVSATAKDEYVHFQHECTNQMRMRLQAYVEAQVAHCKRSLENIDKLKSDLEALL
ncbi:hypothetical protein EMCRGX_G003901 [Ephydatia muelleri]|eukprot:Em0001g3685a